MLRPNRWLFFGGICLALLFLTLAGLLRPVGDVVRFVTLPIVRPITTVASKFRGSTPALTAADVKILNDRLTALAVDSAKLHALAEENAVLRAQARFLSASGYDSVGGRVINREIHGPRALLLIDRGSRDGLEIGQAVITGAGVFVGRVSTLKERVATVELETDMGSRVAAAISNERKLIGVLEGKGNGATTLTYIPSTEHLARNQLIVTAGTDEKIPGDLALGIVNEIQSRPTDPFLSAAIEPLVRMDQIVLVSVLRPSAFTK